VINMNSDFPMVFIGGCPRSGTTLVKRMLDAHPDIYCGPEFGHLVTVCDLYTTMKKGIESGRISSYANKGLLRDYIRSFILSFFRPIFIESGVSVFAEKTPSNIRCFCTLHELFPEAKFIQVIRNPLDVAASYLKVGKRLGEGVGNIHFYSALEAAKHWKQQVLFPQRFKNTFNSQTFQENYYEVKYEDIVNSPEDMAKKICDFINISFNSRMTDLDKPLKGDSKSFGGIFYTQEEYIKGISNSQVNGWADYLSQEDVRYVVKETGFYLHKFGYMSKDEINSLLDYE